MIDWNKIKIKPNPIDTEKKLNYYYDQINQHLLNNTDIPEELFELTTKEFEIVKEKYEKTKDYVNLLHIAHNYYSRASMFYLDKNFEKAFYLYIKALQLLLARIKERNYSDKALMAISKYYHSLCIRIVNEDSEEIVFSRGNIEEFSKIYNHLRDIGNNLDKRFYVIFESIINVYLHKTYKKYIGQTVYEQKDYENLKTIEEHLTLLKDLAINFPSDMKSNLAQINNFIYRVKKFQLYFFLYKYDSSGDSKYIEKVANLTRIMKSSSEEAKKIYEKLSQSTKSLREKEMWINKKIGTIIDAYYADYLHSLYVSSDFFSALRHIDKLHNFLVDTVFKESQRISKHQLNYFSSEMRMLKSFIKLILIEIELHKLSDETSQEKIKQISDQVIKKIQESKILFKYKYDKKLLNYQIKIITRTFSGSISEYLLHELLQDMTKLKLYGNIDNRVKEILYSAVDSSENKIKKNYKFSKSDKQDPDIDIYFDLTQKPLAIFVKNAIFTDKVKKQIYKELIYAKKNNVKNIFFLINMVKNIESLNEMKLFFDNIIKKEKDLKIDVLDIKLLVSEILNQFDRNNFNKFNFSDVDLLRFLNY